MPNIKFHQSLSGVLLCGWNVTSKPADSLPNCVGDAPKISLPNCVGDAPKISLPNCVADAPKISLPNCVADAPKISTLCTQCAVFHAILTISTAICRCAHLTPCSL